MKEVERKMEIGEREKRRKNIIIRGVEVKEGRRKRSKRRWRWTRRREGGGF